MRLNQNDRVGSADTPCSSPTARCKAVRVGRGSIAKDALLVTDGGTYYPKVARELGINHEDLNRSAGERVRGDLHIQTVNSRHEGLKGFIRHFRGVASKYLPNYVRWFHISALPKSPTPQSCLNAALALPA